LCFGWHDKMRCVWQRMLLTSSQDDFTLNRQRQT
jgi:hypothetical protein